MMVIMCIYMVIMYTKTNALYTYNAPYIYIIYIYIYIYIMHMEPDPARHETVQTGINGPHNNF